MAAQVNVHHNNTGYIPPAPPTAAQVGGTIATIVVGSCVAFGFSVAAAAVSPYLVGPVAIGGFLAAAGLAGAVKEGYINSRTVSALPDQMAGLMNNRTAKLAGVTVAATAASVLAAMGSYTLMTLLIGGVVASVYHRYATEGRIVGR